MILIELKYFWPLTLGTDTLYLGVVLCRLRGGLRDRERERVVRLVGERERFREDEEGEPRRSLSRLLSLSRSLWGWSNRLILEPKLNEAVSMPKQPLLFLHYKGGNED